MLKSLLLVSAVLLTTNVFAINKTQCGNTDERVLSYDKAVARMLRTTDGSAGCTGTLIGRTCMISAGHCAAYAAYNEFNTEASVNGKIVHPGPEDVYKLDKMIDYQNGGRGNDWAVYRVQANKITGLYPGDIQGKYEPSFEVPAAPLDITITGYGRDRRSDRNFAQQTATNELVRIEGRTVLRHNIDTQGGNSGSSIIEVGSQKIIGVHTHGGCSSYSVNGANAGTVLANHDRFKAAIIKCLEEETQL